MMGDDQSDAEAGGAQADEQAGRKTEESGGGADASNSPKWSQRRKRVFFGSLLFLAGLAVLLLSSRVRSWAMSDDGLVAIGAVVALLGVALVTGRYLNVIGGSLITVASRPEDESEEVASSFSWIGPFGKVNLSFPKARNNDELFEKLKEVLAKGPPAKEFNVGAVATMCSDSRDRLRLEIEQLSRRGNVNLVLGVVTTLLAAIVLAIVALGEQPDRATLESVLIHYIPRLSLAAFIEIFSFFFLRLYRGALSEIKYFQNELTNVEAKTIALAFAFVSDDQASKAATVESMLRTERNFILKTGETTVDLERSRLEREGAKELFEAALGVVRGTKRETVKEN